MAPLTQNSTLERNQPGSLFGCPVPHDKPLEFLQMCPPPPCVQADPHLVGVPPLSNCSQAPCHLMPKVHHLLQTQFTAASTFASKVVCDCMNVPNAWCSQQMPEALHTMACMLLVKAVVLVERGADVSVNIPHLPCRPCCLQQFVVTLVGDHACDQPMLLLHQCMLPP